MGLSDVSPVDKPIPDCGETGSPDSEKSRTRRRSNRLSIRMASYAYTKLCKLRPRFSVGHVNFNHDYEDMKNSPFSLEGKLLPGTSLARARSSHPFLRQEAVEERRRAFGFLTDGKHSSERSETRTFETHISDDDDATGNVDYSSVSFTVPQQKDYLQVPSCTYTSGCDPCLSSAHLLDVISRRRRKYGNTLKVPSTYADCQITEIDVSPANTSPRFTRVQSVIELERRTRIRKLQADLRKIQQELQDLDELEYTVSFV